MKMFNNIKTIFVNISIFLKKYIGIFFDNACKSFDKCVEGEENLNKMLWFWCIIPNIFFILLACAPLIELGIKSLIKAFFINNSFFGTIFLLKNPKFGLN